jgi:purine-nucleoside phosphorylase
MSGGVFERLEEAAATIRARVPGFVPQVALVLGSGLGGAVRLLANPVALPMAEIPHVRTPTVSGHPGHFVFGTVGRSDEFSDTSMSSGLDTKVSENSIRVAVLQGRLHTYEGWTPEETVFPLRLLVHLGARVVVLTNAAGGVRPGLRSGEWMVVTDHLNLSGESPLRGPNDPRLGPRFPDLSAAYDPELRQRLLRAGQAAGVALQQGVYAMMPGPAYETPAEIRMLQKLGADAVGMSTVLEVLAAVHMGARVACLSCITNPAAGLQPAPLSHGAVEAAAHAAEEDGVRVLRALFGSMG